MLLTNLLTHCIHISQFDISGGRSIIGVHQSLNGTKLRIECLNSVYGPLTSFSFKIAPTIASSNISHLIFAACLRVACESNTSLQLVVKLYRFNIDNVSVQLINKLLCGETLQNKITDLQVYSDV
jgi:hypothetical protein